MQMSEEKCGPRKNSWWFHPKLYVLILWASLALDLIYDSPVISGFFWIWIGCGIAVGLVGIKKMVRRRRSTNSA
jgi:hypothetical protein